MPGAVRYIRRISRALDFAGTVAAGTVLAWNASTSKWQPATGLKYDFATGNVAIPAALSIDNLSVRTANRELLWQSSGDYLNCVAFQNLSTTNSFSAVAFRRNTGVEGAAVGMANPEVTGTFANAAYVEASYYTGEPHTIKPPRHIRVQTGYLNGAYGAFLRDEFDTEGNYSIFGPDGLTSNLKIGVDGAVELGKAGSDTGYRFKISTNYPATDTPNFVRMVRDGYVKWDLQINHTPLRLDVVDTDHSAVIPLSIALDGSKTAIPGAAITASGQLGSDYTVTDAYADTGLYVDLPSAGTYLLSWCARGSLKLASGTFGLIQCKLYNSTASADVANSETLLVFAGATGQEFVIQSGRTATISVGTASRIKLYAQRIYDGSVTSSSIQYNANGRSTMTAVKLANS